MQVSPARKQQGTQRNSQYIVLRVDVRADHQRSQQAETERQVELPTQADRRYEHRHYGASRQVNVESLG
jgi:hypothetical protein